ncbi:MAG: Syh [Pseudomonadota bacterium]|jgi:histidyl-tRNA synthetase
MASLTAIKGMNDVLPQDIAVWHFFEQTAKLCLKQFGYNEIRTPILEHTEVFVRGIGQVTDIVEKEMYSFNDSLNGEHLTLRPEGTAAAVRSVIQNHLLYDGGKKLWYIGPMFRHERPQRGRYRQFHQLGLESLGFAHPQADVELILFAHTLFQKLGIQDKLCLNINSLGNMPERLKHREALIVYFEQNIGVLDEDSLKRLKTNPLRILDSKNPTMQDMIEKAPSILEFLEEESLNHFNTIKFLLDGLNIPYQVNHRLVRGLDYYNRTVFEWITEELGAQGTVCGGGRYDPLIEIMGGKSSPAVGLAMGIERILELIKMTDYTKPAKNNLYVLYSGENAVLYSLQLSAKLRSFGVTVIQHTHTELQQQSLKSQMKKASASNSEFAIVINEDNIQNKSITVKNLDNGQEQLFNIEDINNLDNLQNIANYILNK